MKTLIGSLVSLLAAFALITWWALEWDGVGIVETRAEDGSVRSTHVWFVEPDGEFWLEAGTPQNPWYLDALRDPVISFASSGPSGRYTTQPIEDPGAHERIRSLLREKYGFRDWWVGLLVDTSGSIAVRLAQTQDVSR